jgi:hypothetical protein
MIRQKRLSVLAFMALPAITGCTGVLVWASEEDASWLYIRQNCHGMTIGPASATQTGLSFPIDVHDVVNSSMCIYDARMRLADNRILVSVRHGLCSGSTPSPLVASLPKPAPGEYAIAYDDPAADFPVIARAHVE